MLILSGKKAIFRRDSEKSKDFSIFAQKNNMSCSQFDFFKGCLDNIYEYCYYLGFDPHDMQREFFDSYQAGNKRICIRSGQGTGKTASSVVIHTHNLIKYPNTRTIITAPTAVQCRDVWIAEAKTVIRKAKLDKIKEIFDVKDKSIGIFGNRYNEWGLHTKAASTMDAFAGAHNARQSFHCEEASGIPSEIMETIEGTLTNETYLWTAISNPLYRSGKFHEICTSPKEKKKWDVLHWNAENMPTDVPYFNHERNTELAEKYGKESNIYYIRVRGDFPKSDTQALMTMEDLIECTKPSAKLKAMAQNLTLKRKGYNYVKRAGIDLSSLGGDESSFSLMDGMIQVDSYTEGNIQIEDFLHKADNAVQKKGWSNKDVMFVYDANGIGQGGSATFRLEMRNRNSFGFMGSNAPRESKQYTNKITEAWDLFAERVKKGEIYLLYDEETFRQLCTRRVNIDNRGRIAIETKKRYRERMRKENPELAKSPDRADALIMASYPYVNKGKYLIRSAR